MVFSIIIPVYNAEKYLNKCVESILSQSFERFELILVDDGSTDGSLQICNAYAQKDDRVKVVHKTNSGASDARNAGLDIAVGEYIVFVDSDDYWDDALALAKIKGLIDEGSPDVVTWRFKKYIEAKDVVKPVGYSLNGDEIDFGNLLKSKNFNVSPCAKAIKKSLIDEFKLNFLSGVCAEDIEWCARLLSVTKQIVPSNLDFYVYRQREESSSHTIKERNVKDVKSHLLFIDGLIQEGNHNAEKIQQLLAEEFCNFVVTLTSYDKYKEEIGWVKQRKSWLKWGRTRRSKILKLMLSILGVNLTLKIIKFIR